MTFIVKIIKNIIVSKSISLPCLETMKHELRNSYDIKMKSQNLLTTLCENDFLDSDHKIIENIDFKEVDKKVLLDELNSKLQRYYKRSDCEEDLNIEDLNINFCIDKEFKVSNERWLSVLIKMGCQFENNDKDLKKLKIISPLVKKNTNEALSKAFINVCKVVPVPNASVFEKLIAKGVDPSYNKSEALRFCCQDDKYLEIVKVLLKNKVKVYNEFIDLAKNAPNILVELVDHL